MEDASLQFNLGSVGGKLCKAALVHFTQVCKAEQPARCPERWLIWQLHVPAAYAIEQRRMEVVATRSASTGGQNDGRVINSTHLVAASAYTGLG